MGNQISPGNLDVQNVDAQIERQHYRRAGTLDKVQEKEQYRKQYGKVQKKKEKKRKSTVSKCKSKYIF
jgi:hypothetical protein